MPPAETAHHRRGPAHRVGNQSAHGARHLRYRARNDLRDSRRIRQREEHTAAIPDRTRAADGRSNRYRRRGRAASVRGRAAVRCSLSVGRALQLHDTGRQPRAPVDQVDPDTRRHGAGSRSGEARPRRARGVRRPSAWRDLGRHEEARRHCAGHDARARVCCSSTSRPPDSTRSPRSSSTNSSSRSAATSASPSSS